MKNLTPLTPEQKNRVVSSLVETQDKLEKELSYSKDLQHTDMITFYRQHIVKLNNMLKHGWNAPVFN